MEERNRSTGQTPLRRGTRNAERGTRSTRTRGPVLCTSLTSLLFALSRVPFISPSVCAGFNFNIRRIGSRVAVSDEPGGESSLCLWPVHLEENQHNQDQKPTSHSPQRTERFFLPFNFNISHIFFDPIVSGTNEPSPHSLSYLPVHSAALYGSAA